MSTKYTPGPRRSHPDPTRREVHTKHGTVVLRRIGNDNDWLVFMDGVRIGRICKFQKWYAGEDGTARTSHKTRLGALEYAIVGWYQAQRAIAAIATGSAA